LGKRTLKGGWGRRKKEQAGRNNLKKTSAVGNWQKKNQKGVGKDEEKYPTASWPGGKVISKEKPGPIRNSSQQVRKKIWGSTE